MSDFIKTIENSYDYIVFDTPPIGVVIDSVPILKIADGVVVVVRNNTTTYPELNKTLDTLNRSDTKVLGIIVNRVNPVESKKYSKYKNYSKGYGGYYGYY